MGDNEQKEKRRRNLQAKRLHEGRTGEYKLRVINPKKTEYKRVSDRELYNKYNHFTSDVEPDED